MKFVLFFALSLFSAVSFSAENQKGVIPVLVAAQCENDNVGQRLAFKVREGLRSSTNMASVETYEKSVIMISIVCLDPEIDERSTLTRYSYAITGKNTDGHYDYLLNHGVGSCGTNRVSSCAESLVAEIDTAIEDLRVKVEKGLFKYKQE